MCGEREKHMDGESKGMERVHGWKEIDGLHEHIKTKKLYMTLLCL